MLLQLSEFMHLNKMLSLCIALTNFEGDIAIASKNKFLSVIPLLEEKALLIM